MKNLDLWAILVKYLAPIAIAILGSLVSYLQLVYATKEAIPLRSHVLLVLMKTLTAAFVGILVVLLGDIYSWSTSTVGIVAGISGLHSAEALSLIWKKAKNKLT